MVIAANTLLLDYTTIQLPKFILRTRYKCQVQAPAAQAEHIFIDIRTVYSNTLMCIVSPSDLIDVCLNDNN